MDEQKVRDAAKVAAELTATAPDHAYAVIWMRVFDAMIYADSEATSTLGPANRFQRKRLSGVGTSCKGEYTALKEKRK